MTSPQYSHAGAPPPFSGPVSVSSAGGMPPSFSSGHLSLGAPGGANSGQPFHDFELNFFDNTLSDRQVLCGHIIE